MDEDILPINKLHTMQVPPASGSHPIASIPRALTMHQDPPRNRPLQTRHI